MSKGGDGGCNSSDGDDDDVVDECLIESLSIVDTSSVDFISITRRCSSSSNLNRESCQLRTSPDDRIGPIRAWIRENSFDEIFCKFTVRRSYESREAGAKEEVRGVVFLGGFLNIQRWDRKQETRERERERERTSGKVGIGEGGRRWKFLCKRIHNWR